MLSPAKAGAASGRPGGRGHHPALPVLGLLLFALVATFMPYPRSTWDPFDGQRSDPRPDLGAVLWHIFLSRLPPAPALRYRTERMLLWLMLFTVLPFVVGQVSIKAEASGLSNWLRWLLNLSIVFLAGRLLVERKNRETLVIALLLGTLAMLLMSIAVFIRYRSASGMAPILAMFNYANLDTPRSAWRRFPRGWARHGCTPTPPAGSWPCCCPWRSATGRQPGLAARPGPRRGGPRAAAILRQFPRAMLSLAVVLF